MDEATKKQVDEFVSLPRAERKAKFQALPQAVQRAARAQIEKRRGIALRTAGGIPVLTPALATKELVRLKSKCDKMDARKEAVERRILEIKSQLEDVYGAEALAEAENALESNA